MKGKKIVIVGIFCLLMIMIIISGERINVQAATKKYSFVCDECSTFKKSGSRITVKIIKNGYNGLRLNNKIVSRGKVVLNLSKRCNWSQTPGGALPYKKASYRKIKNQISHEYNYRKRYGDYDSPSIVVITVKNGKVTRVNLSCF